MGGSRGEECPRHPGQVLSANCGQCNAPICRQCIQSFGYFCSADCLKTSRQGVTALDRRERVATLDKLETSMRWLRRAGLVALVLGLLLAGWLIRSWFFNPFGQAAWQYPKDGDGTLALLGTVSGERLYLAQGQAILVMDPLTGRELARFDYPKLKAEGGQLMLGDPLERVTVESDHLVFRGDAGLVVTGPRGEPRGQLQFPDEDTDEAWLSPDGQTGVYTSHEWVDRSKWLAKTTIHCADIPSGKLRWSKTMKPELHLMELQVGQGGVALLLRQPLAVPAGQAAPAMEEDDDEDAPAGAKANFPLVIFALDQAKVLSQTTLTKQPDWGPEPYGAGFLVAVGGEVRGLLPDGTPMWRDAAGQERRLSIPEDGDGEPADLLRREDYLLMLMDGGTICYDLPSGEGLWRSKLTLDEEGIILTPKAFHLYGQITKGSTTVDLTRMPGFDQAPDVLKDYGIEKVTRTQSVRVLLTLARQDGRLLWQEEGFSGRLFANGERLVTVFDTARDSMLAMMREVGDLVITEYDVATGKRRGQRVHKAWLGEDLALAGERFLVLTLVPGMVAGQDPEEGYRVPGLRTLRALQLK